MILKRCDFGRTIVSAQQLFRCFFFFFQAEDGIRDLIVTGVQTCALPICLIPREVAEKYSVLPLSRVGATLTLAMVDPTNVFAMDDIKFMTGLNIEPVVVSEAGVQEAIDRYYGGSREIELLSTAEASTLPGANGNGNGNGNGFHLAP